MTVIDAKGLAVAPGFINMLSWSTESLLADGLSQSEMRQGVTTQIMGESESMGPVNDAIRKRMKAEQADIKFEIEWTSLADYLTFLERRGVTQNVASFIGASTIREYVLGRDNKKATPEDLDRMRKLVELEMRNGALGIGSALEYAPAYYADTDELIELCKVAAKYKGKYISHMRSEGRRLLEGIDEVIRISREAKLPAEIYHFKAAGKENWSKMDAAIAKVEAARKDGLAITANMYCYTAGCTGLDACIPPWAQDGGDWPDAPPAPRPGGPQEDSARHRDQDRLAELLPERRRPEEHPAGRLQEGRPEAAAGQDAGRGRGRAEARPGRDAHGPAGRGRVAHLTVYFMMTEENVRKLIRLPWVSFGSDEASQAPEGVFLKSMPHPRAYGNFARLLGKYVRDEKLIPMEEAIRKLTQPAGDEPGPGPPRAAQGRATSPTWWSSTRAAIADRATFEKPHQYAVGVKHVFVNGTQVLNDGEHTGAKPGRALWGPGKVDR